jgi:hypothetical protein
LVPGTTLALKKFFLKVVPVTKCSSKIFQKFFRSQNKVFGPVQIPKKYLFLNFFLRFLGVFVPVPNAKKWYISDLIPVLKVNLGDLKNNFSLLVPVLNPKCTTFSHFVPVQRPLEIEQKNLKKDV